MTAAMAAPSALELIDLSIVYKLVDRKGRVDFVDAVDGVSFSIEPGHFVCIVGEIGRAHV